MPYTDIKKRRLNWKERYHKDKLDPRYRQMRMARTAKYRAVIVDYVQNLKATTPCKDCDETYPHYVMHFDHCKGKKSFTIAYKIYSYGRQRILDEIKKCEIVCSNCHAKRTWERAHPQLST